MNRDGLTSISYALIEPPKRSLLTLNRLLILMVSGLLVWSAYAELDVMIFAQGSVISSSDIKTIQHLEGGIVSEIFVKKGDQVKVNDPLLKIDNVNIDTRLGELNNRLISINAALVRLNAEIDGKGELIFSDQMINESPKVVRNELELFNENRNNLLSQTQSLTVQLQKNKLTQNELNKQIMLASENIVLMEEELQVTQSLYEQDAISKVELLQLQRKLHELTSEKQRLTSIHLNTENEAVRIRQSINKIRADFVSEAIKKRNDLENKRNETMEVISGASNQSVRSIVRSPVNGVVNQVLVNTIGGVVQPAMDLIEIVPEDKNFLINAKIQPADIALLALEQPAKVRLTAYDFAIYGSLDGVVSYIGADTLEEKNGNQYYVAHIRINNTLHSNGRDYPVRPGMIAKVDIITGKRTILNYLIKPITKTTQRALREE